MKSLVIDGNKWSVVDSEKPHLKPKEIADSVSRYIHYPISDMKNITVGGFSKRVYNGIGLERYYRRTLNASMGWYSDGKANGHIVAVWKPKVENGVFTLGVGLSGPNTHYLEPNFNMATVWNSYLYLDPVINLFGFSGIMNFTVDNLARCCIIHLYGGDAECSNGVVSINKNNQVSR